MRIFVHIWNPMNTAYNCTNANLALFCHLSVFRRNHGSTIIPTQRKTVCRLPMTIKLIIPNRNIWFGRNISTYVYILIIFGKSWTEMTSMILEPDPLWHKPFGHNEYRFMHTGNKTIVAARYLRAVRKVLKAILNQFKKYVFINYLIQRVLRASNFLFKNQLKL